MPNQETSTRRRKGQARLSVLLIVLLLVPLAYSVVSRFVPRGTASADVFLERPPAKYKNCVKDTEYMRYHHWELLRETREQVVRYGIRGEIALDGRIPIATMGGLKGRGHPVGATGMYQLAEATLQLRGEAGENQIPDARLGMTQNIGGSGGTVVSHVLEAWD